MSLNLEELIMKTGKDPAYIAYPTKSGNISGPKKTRSGKGTNSENLSQYLYSTSLHIDANSIILESIQHLPASIRQSVDSILDHCANPARCQNIFFHRDKFKSNGDNRLMRSERRSGLARVASVWLAATDVVTGLLNFQSFIPSIATIAKRAMVSIRTCYEHLKTLKMAGIIEIKQNRKRDPSTGEWYSNTADKIIRKGFLQQFLPPKIADIRQKSLNNFKSKKLSSVRRNNIVIARKLSPSARKGLSSLKNLLNISRLTPDTPLTS